MAAEEKAEIVGKFTQLLFECAVCKKMYDKPGMCQACNIHLKPKGG